MRTPGDGWPFRIPEMPGIFGREKTNVRATKNVMSPLQWWLALTLAFMSFSAALGPTELRVASWCVAVAAIALFAVTYLGALLTQPDRLQSEEHRQTMAYIHHQYRDDRGITLDATATNVPPPEPAPDPGNAAALPGGTQ